MFTRRMLCVAGFILALVSASPGQWMSLHVPRDGACFYTKPDFNGERYCVGVDENLGTLPHTFSRKISSIRLYGQAEAVLFGGRNFQGEQLHMAKSVSDLKTPAEVQSSENWRKRVQSVRIVFNPALPPRAPRRTSDGIPDHGACFFEKQRYKGSRICVAAGERLNIPEDSREHISSIRLYGRSHAVLYDEPDFAGTQSEIWSSERDLTALPRGDERTSTWKGEVRSVQVIQ